MFRDRSNVKVVLECDAGYVDGIHSRAQFDSIALWDFAQDFIEDETIVVNEEFVDAVNDSNGLAMEDNENNAKNAKSIYNELLKVIDSEKAALYSNYEEDEEVELRAIVRKHRTHNGRPQVFLEIPGVSAKWVYEAVLNYD